MVFFSFFFFFFMCVFFSFCNRLRVVFSSNLFCFIRVFIFLSFITALCVCYVLDDGLFRDFLSAIVHSCHHLPSSSSQSQCTFFHISRTTQSLFFFFYKYLHLCRCCFSFTHLLFASIFIHHSLDFRLFFFLPSVFALACIWILLMLVFFTRLLLVFFFFHSLLDGRKQFFFSFYFSIEFLYPL